MAELVNTYAAQKVDKGELDGSKKINIEFGCTIFGGIPSVEMYRSQHEYHILLHEWPDLKRLFQIVDYFASPHWESLVYEKQEQYESALNLFDKRLEQYAANPDTSLFSKPVTIFIDGDLRLKYKDKTLRAVIGTTYVPLEIGSIHPVKFKDRYIIFGNERILVYENGNLILEYNIPPENNYEIWNHDYFSEVYNDWLNVYYNNKSYPIFSYCYSKNRFYRL